ncbi:protein-tyrosine phosphatase, active site protein [Pochonia chlamydosporia 170]|uniref:Protein-tyrosine phosphatase, active site protein n=1 Tax=Pochonia chlamydosporia 170 TaxID=1380566 RepID=A0A179F946_METCM|nr:protein-tyrosine phosphatase, active site protein [Pochonia chlamydosporia 170]OAQ61974.1 protein-tyrosine phosphatase, active site protein [Pochonia chlamydosporia 170]
MPLSPDELDALSATDVREPLAPEVLLPVLTSAPFIPSRSLFNLRDLGAVPGSALPTTRFYRSGFLQGAAQDPEAQAWLASHVRRIFDLRIPEERESAPDPAIPGVENVWLDVEDGYPMPPLEEFAVDGGQLAWKKEYMNCALAYRPLIRKILEHIRDTPAEPVLFHCTAGRDRTGVVAGLLHALAASPADASTRDYMLSRIGTEPAREKLMHYAMSTLGIKDPETPGFYDLVSLRPVFWQRFQEALDEDFGGWDGYVTRGLGFSEGDLQKIKANLRFVD